MPFSETTRLHDHGTLQGKFQLFLSRLQWKHLCLGLFCLLPFILWIGVLQNYESVPPPEIDDSPDLLTTLPLTLMSARGFRNHNSTTDGFRKLNSTTDGFGKGNSTNTGFWKQNATNSLSSAKGNQTALKGNPLNLKVQKYEFVITSATLYPDNFAQETYLINGQYPGPSIRVRQNSTLQVTIVNRLVNNSITIHFHGIHQRGTFLSDGVPNVTQRPVAPGQTFVHVFDTWPQLGTFFYHAHTGMDITSLYGPLIIEDDPVKYKLLPAAYQYDAEHIVTLSGIYHQQLDVIIQRIMGTFHWYPADIDSVTLNGKSFGVWGNETTLTHRNSSYEVLSVRPGLRYRFRFINAASDSILSCNVSAHNFTVIEMDGIYTEPLETDTLVISPGQRYSTIMQMDQDPGNYQIVCKHMETSGPRNGIGFLNYKGASYPSKKLRQEDRGLLNESLDISRWIVDDLTPNHALNQTDVYALPTTVDQEFFLDVYEAVNGTQNRYLINGHLWQDPASPYTEQLSRGLNITDENQVLEIRSGSVVQFVFQNRRARQCFSHPWHIHGHSFYVVGEGPDLYDPVKDGEALRERTRPGNGNRFQFRDTVTLYANQSRVENQTLAYGDACGWTAIRFVANNPGVWLAHCHVTPHMIMGKKFVFWEHSEEDPYLIQLMKTNLNNTMSLL